MSQTDPTVTLEHLNNKQLLLLTTSLYDQMLLEGLLGQAGVVVTITQDLASTLQIIEQTPPNFLLVDLNQFPEAIEEVNVLEGLLEELPLLIGIVSSSSDPLPQPLAGVLYKPISPQQLFSALLTSLHQLPPAPSSPIELPNSAHIDTQEGLMRLGGNRKTYARILTLFGDNQRQVAAEIGEALLDHDLDTAHRLAHTVKGLAGSIGARNIQQTAIPLDQALKAGDIPQATALLAPFSQAIHAVISDLDQWRKQSETTPPFGTSDT